MPQSRSDIPEQLTTRNSEDDLNSAIANVNTRGADEPAKPGSSDNNFDTVERNIARDFTPESLSARDTPEDFLAAVLGGRSLNSGQEIQARNWFSDFRELVNQAIRRDVTLDQLLAARDGAELEDAINSIMGSRDSNPEQGMQARDGIAGILNSLVSRRDVAPDGLADRGNSGWEDFVETMYTREFGFKRDIHARGLFTSILAWAVHKLMSLPLRARFSTSDEFAGRDDVSDKVHDFISTYMPNHATREPSPQQNTQARSTPDGTPGTVAPHEGTTNAFIKALLSSRDEHEGYDTVSDFLDAYRSNHATRAPSNQQETQAGVTDGPTKAAVQNGSATDAFIDALLNARDSSKDFTADDVLTLASLASRALDELD